MTIRTVLSLIFLSVIIFLPSVLTTEQDTENLEQCIFVELTDKYYGLYLEDVKDNHCSPKHFWGICDLDALSQWKPCPFVDYDSVCYPNGEKIQRKICNRGKLQIQTLCNCSGSLNCHQLQPLPDFPTCFLGEPSTDCTPERRDARNAPTINNCTRCMTKHPNAGMERAGSLDLRRVKRAEITPPIRGGFQTMNRRKSLGCRRSDYAFGWKYRRDVAMEDRNRQFRSRKPTNNERRLERTSNIALIRILRRISNSQSIVKRQQDGDDDDDDDDDNIGEDIAIEEDNEMEISTTETPETDERRLQQHKDFTKHNVTENFNEDQQVKASNGFRSTNSRFLTLTCGVLVVNFWLRKI